MGLVTLFDVLCTIVGYISYNIGNRNLPGIYALALGPPTLCKEITGKHKLCMIPVQQLQI